MSLLKYLNDNSDKVVKLNLLDYQQYHQQCLSDFGTLPTEFQQRISEFLTSPRYANDSSQQQAFIPSTLIELDIARSESDERVFYVRQLFILAFSLHDKLLKLSLSPSVLTCAKIHEALTLSVKGYGVTGGNASYLILPSEQTTLSITALLKKGYGVTGGNASYPILPSEQTTLSITALLNIKQYFRALDKPLDALLADKSFSPRITASSITTSFLNKQCNYCIKTKSL